MRNNGRAANQLRDIKFTRNYTRHAEGSVLVEYGDTKVICTASVEGGVPRFLRGKNQGWLTAEYSMLPRATHTRGNREAARGKQTGRTQEIQRLIGRSLRAAVDLSKLGDHTITVDCDVIQADGGTRTAAITGGCVALADAIAHLLRHNKIKDNPLQHMIGSVSVGVVNNEAVLDLDYPEDSTAQTDMNVIMNEEQGFIELQGTAESDCFSQPQLLEMLDLATSGITQLIEMQKQALGLTG